MPGILITSAKLTGVETSAYFRNKSAIFWTFAYPIILLVVLMMIFGSGARDSHVDIVGNKDASNQLVTIFEQQVAEFGGGLVKINKIQSGETSPLGRLRVELPQTVPIVTGEPETIKVLVPNVVSQADGVFLSILERTVSALNLRAVNQPASVVLHYVTKENTSFSLGSLWSGTSGDSFGIYAVSGICVMMVISISLFGFTSPLIEMRANGDLRWWEVLPVQPIAYLLAFSSCRFLILVLFSLLFLSIGSVVYAPELPLSSLNWAGLFVFLSLGVFAFLAIGLLLASLINSTVTGQAVINIANLPIMFLSDLIIPIGWMPHSVQSIVTVLPPYQFVDGVRKLIEPDVGLLDVWGESLLLLVIGIVALGLSAHLFRWKLEE